jgi:hypothetical protein
MMRRWAKPADGQEHSSLTASEGRETGAAHGLFTGCAHDASSSSRDVAELSCTDATCGPPPRASTRRAAKCPGERVALTLSSTVVSRRSCTRSGVPSRCRHYPARLNGPTSVEGSPRSLALICWRRLENLSWDLQAHGA